MVSKYDMRLHAMIGSLAGQISQAQATAATANAAALSYPRCWPGGKKRGLFSSRGAEPKYENKKKDFDVRQWLPIIEYYHVGLP